jgi:hypothetical protein
LAAAYFLIRVAGVRCFDRRAFSEEGICLVKGEERLAILVTHAFDPE